MELFLFARLHASAGNSNAVQQAVLAVQGPTRSEPGCLDYKAFQSIRDSDEFYIHSCWKDKAAFENHLNEPHTRRFAARVEPLLDHPLRVTLAKHIP